MSMISAATKRLRAALATVAGPGMIGFSLAQAYAAGTLGAFVKGIMAGPTFTGPVTLPGDAVDNLHAVPLQQLSSTVSSAVATGVANILDGATFSGPITLPGDAVGENDAVRLQQVLDLLEVVAGEIILEKPGDLIMTASPTMAPGTKRLLVQGQVIARADYPTLDFLWCGAGLNNDPAASDFFFRFSDAGNPNATRDIAGAYMLLPPAGYFLRPLNTGGGLDAGRSPFKLQDSSNRSHAHALLVDSSGSAPNGQVSSINGGDYGIGGDSRPNSYLTQNGVGEALMSNEGGGEARPLNWGVYVWLAW